MLRAGRNWRLADLGLGVASLSPSSIPKVRAVGLACRRRGQPHHAECTTIDLDEHRHEALPEEDRVTER